MSTLQPVASAPRPKHGPDRKAGIRARPWWPVARRLLTAAFFVGVAWLIVRQARTIDWADVGGAMRALPAPSIFAAVGLSAASYLLYSTYDLLGRSMTGHRLGTGTVMGVTFVCYAFNLNLGSLVGSVALRYRLYRRLGLDNDVVTRIIGFSFLTNWFGYLAIAGAAFCFGSLSLPADWKIGSGGLRVVGVVLMALAAGYLVLCARSGARVWNIRGHELETPSLRMGLVQLAVSVGNWALMGAVAWVLIRHGSYVHVLAVLLVACVAGLISHVPAGVGVIEAVFLALMGGEMPQGRLLGALLAYRAVYYLLPLAVASVFYLVTEMRAKRLRRAARSG